MNLRRDAWGRQRQLHSMATALLSDLLVALSDGTIDAAGIPLLLKEHFAAVPSFRLRALGKRLLALAAVRFAVEADEASMSRPAK